MNPDPNRWWKGSLPSWMGVALVTVAIFAGKRLLNEHDRLIEQVNILGSRVASLEVRLESVQVAMGEARTAIHGPNTKQ